MGLYQGDKPLSAGKSPVAYAKDAGYAGTDTNFYTALADMPDHISDSENPHGTTASQVGAYTKDETNTLLQKKADTTKKTTVTLSTNWTGDASPYTQIVTISGTTINSKVDLQPDATTITQMLDDGTVALYIANSNGKLTANAVGEKPTVALTIQATIMEVSA